MNGEREFSNIRDVVEDVLRHHSVRGWVDEDGEPLSLLDHVSPGPDVAYGIETLHLLADDIAQAVDTWKAARPTSTGQGLTDEDVMTAERAFWPVYLECIRKHGAKRPAHQTGMRAALESVALPARVPDGWKLVPIEPTDLMLNSFLGGYGARGGSFNATHLRDRAREGYRELLLASPSPNAQKS